MLCQREYFVSTRELAFRSDRPKAHESLNRMRFFQPEERSGWLAALTALLETCPLLSGVFGDKR